MYAITTHDNRTFATFLDYDWAMCWLCEQSYDGCGLKLKHGRTVLFDTIKQKDELAAERAKYGV